MALVVDGTLKFSPDNVAYSSGIGGCLNFLSNWVALAGSGVIDGSGTARRSVPGPYRPTLVHFDSTGG